MPPSTVFLNRNWNCHRKNILSIKLRFIVVSVISHSLESYFGCTWYIVYGCFFMLPLCWLTFFLIPIYLAFIWYDGHLVLVLFITNLRNAFSFFILVAAYASITSSMMQPHSTLLWILLLNIHNISQFYFIFFTHNNVRSIQNNLLVT